MPRRRRPIERESELFMPAPPFVIEPDTILESTVTPATRFPSLLWEEYCNQIDVYIRSLNENNEALYDSNISTNERHLLSLMTRLRLVDHSGFPEQSNSTARWRVNSIFDPTNLTQRLLLLYAHTKGLLIIEEIEFLIEHRPYDSRVWERPTIPGRTFTMSDFGFLSPVNIEAPLSLYEDGEDLTRPHICDFVVNSQKIRLVLMTVNNSRSARTACLNICITSRRGTNLRSIARLESHNRTLAFTRMSLQRPTHGFKFVRNMNRVGLFIKEIK